MEFPVRTPSDYPDRYAGDAGPVSFLPTETVPDPHDGIPVADAIYAQVRDILERGTARLGPFIDRDLPPWTADTQLAFALGIPGNWDPQLQPQYVPAHLLAAMPTLRGALQSLHSTRDLLLIAGGLVFAIAALR